MLIRLTLAFLVSFSISQSALATSGFKKEIPVAIKNKVVHLLNELCIEKDYCTMKGLTVSINEPYCLEVYVPSFYWPFYESRLNCHFGANAKVIGGEYHPTVTDSVELNFVEELLDITDNYESLNPKVVSMFTEILEEVTGRAQHDSRNR